MVVLTIFLLFPKQVYPKFKISTAEEGNFQKNLLLCLVRLIHADPMLMLNSQV